MILLGFEIVISGLIAICVGGIVLDVIGFLLGD